MKKITFILFISTIFTFLTSINLQAQDTTAPVAAGQDITVLLTPDNTGALVGSIEPSDLDDGSTDDVTTTENLIFHANITEFTCADIGANTVLFYVEDEAGNTSLDGAGTALSLTVTVTEEIDPVATAQDITVALDANGSYTLTAAEINNGSTDSNNCTADEDLTLSIPATTYDCSSIGVVNTVTLTVTDEAGNSDTATATVTVVDSAAPTVVTQDLTVNLDATTGLASVTAAEIEDGSSDNCTADADLVFSLDPTSFDCTNVGANTVTLTVTDEAGNEGTGTAVVTVVDNTDPTLVGQNISVSLDSSGAYTLNVSEVDGGSSDNCDFTLSFGYEQISVTDPATGVVTVTEGDAILTQDLDCTDLGANNITIYARDDSGNEVNAVVVVTVVDDADATVALQDTTVSLDVNGFVTVTASDLDNGSSDNCSDNANLTFEFDTDGDSVPDSATTTLQCSDIGDTTFTVYITDEAGNETSGTAVVTVEDNTAPTAFTQNITVSIGTGGTVTITPAQVNTDNNGNGLSSDNCSDEFLTLTLDNDTFTCDDIGQNTVTLTVTDSGNNTDSATAVVTVVDLTEPDVNVNDITVALDANGAAAITFADLDNGSTDGCTADADLTTSLSVSAFDCTDLGNNTVTVEITDSAGNVGSADAVVTIVDTSAPTLVVQNVTASLDANGALTAVASDFDNGSTDNCTANGDLVFSLDPSAFDCTNAGDNTVQVTATDEQGNATTLPATLTVVDDIAPTVLANDITVALGTTGLVSITTADVDGGSTDNCPLTLSLSKSAFSCDDLGANNVTLTGTDAAGNSTDAAFVVTVEDNITPTVVAQDITVVLDINGAATITAADIDGGSSDNCDLTLAIDINSFDCTDIGTVVVTLTGSDAATNSATDTATVTIVDDMDPTVVTQDISVSLDANGAASITTADIDNGSSDNCTADADLTFALDETAFDCEDLGSNTVTLTVTDEQGNFHSETAVVTVVDDSAPTIAVADASVSLDANGNATITGDLFDNLSSDNCSDNANLTFSVNIDTYDCTNLGANAVVVTAEDESGNQVTANAVLTVVDDSAPTIVTQDVTVTLDANGAASITTADIENGSFDNCTADADLTLTLDVDSFDCTNLGENTVRLSVADATGNAFTEDITVAGTTASTYDVSGFDTGIPSESWVAQSFTANATGVLSSLAISKNSTGTNYTDLTISVYEGGGIFDTANPPGAVLSTFTVDATGSATLLDAFDIDQADQPSLTAGNEYTIFFDFSTTNGGDGTNAGMLADVDQGLGTLSVPAYGAPNTAYAYSLTMVANITTPDVTTTYTGATATVTVVDNIAPTVVAQDVAIVLGANGSYTLTPAEVDNGSSDNCTLTLSLNQTEFDCTDLGTNYVILTGTDESGNSTSAAPVTITVTEANVPVVAVQDISVSLDANGAATITYSDIDNGSADGCSAVEDLVYQIDVSSFTCANIGPNNVVLTVTDEQNNSDSATAVVTIVDDSAPTVVAQNVTVALDADGNGSVTAADIENGSSDNCSDNANLTFAIDVNAFTCDNLGANDVVLTVTDEQNNSATSTVTVTVVDNIDPVAVANDITVELDANGSAVLDIDDVGASTDNCAIYEEWVNETTFDCADLGANTVSFVAEDTSENQNVTTFTVTVEDNLAPVAVAQDVTVSLDANGSYTLTAAEVDNGSSDNCTDNSALTLSLNTTAFDCTNIAAATTVTLTVEDASGNTDTATASVTVVDDMVPTVVTQDVTLTLDAN